MAIARQSLAIEGLLSDMLGQAIESVSLAQRSVRCMKAILLAHINTQRWYSFVPLHHPEGNDAPVPIGIPTVWDWSFRTDEGAYFGLAVLHADFHFGHIDLERSVHGAAWRDRLQRH